MASAVIHMIVGKRVNEILQLEQEQQFLFGTIAPDMAKHLGMSKNVSHFIGKNDQMDIPNIDTFLGKYKEYLNNPYELGYYVHLLTDKLWFSEFLTNYIDGNELRDKDGNIVTLSDDTLTKILYNDYTYLADRLMSYYNYDYKLFYDEIDYPKNHIEEIPVTVFPKIAETMSKYSLTQTDVDIIISLESVVHFIEYATIYCLDEIKKLDL